MGYTEGREKQHVTYLMCLNGIVGTVRNGKESKVSQNDKRWKVVKSYNSYAEGTQNMKEEDEYNISL